MCTHVYSPVSVGKHIVYATGSRYVRSDWYVPMDLSIYLDVNSWGPIRGAKPLPYEKALSKMPVGWDNDGQFIFIRWEDFKTIGQDRLNRIVSTALRALDKGLSVEVGCIGAHGRTGSVLAALVARAEGLGTQEAIEEVRSRYCSLAVETVEQEKMLYEFCGEPIPPKLDSPSTYTYIPKWDDVPNWGDRLINMALGNGADRMTD